MEIADYNKGRSIKDIDHSKRYKDGLRANLRPNTMWPDERYIDVTLDEVIEAKKRH